MLDPGRRTLATTRPPGRIVSGTFGPTSTTRPKFSCPMTRKSSPGGAAPYSASLISLSVPSTPTRRTWTRTPLPSATSSTLGFGISSRWIELRLPGVTAMAFMPRLSRRRRLRYSRPVAQVEAAEAQLLDALRAGDEDAFAALVREYHPSLVRVARTYVSTLAAAEEVAQETWLGVLNGLDRFEGRSSLRTWIFRILTNIAKTRAQRDGRTLPFSALQDPGRVPEPAVDADRFLDPEHPRWPGHWAIKPEPWPEDALERAETRTRLLEAIEALPASQRAVISLRDIEGWASEEVCNALEISETNQRVLLHRARSKVRRALEEYLDGE